LADQLVEAGLSHDAIALVVDVEAVRRTRALAVDRNPEPGGAIGWRRQNEGEGARVESVPDVRVRLVGRCRPPANRPVAGQRPLVCLQKRGRRVLVWSPVCGDALHGEALRSTRADVRLRRSNVGPVGRGFDSLRVDGWGLGEVARAGLFEQIPDGA